MGCGQSAEVAARLAAEEAKQAAILKQASKKK